MQVPAPSELGKRRPLMPIHDRSIGAAFGLDRPAAPLNKAAPGKTWRAADATWEYRDL
jgi:hypothetical protein